MIFAIHHFAARNPELLRSGYIREELFEGNKIAWFLFVARNPELTRSGEFRENLFRVNDIRLRISFTGVLNPENSQLGLGKPDSAEHQPVAFECFD